eukprot:CAMPEP_0198659700 /NCGR_PEP_ID=MMETSP1467-20131203/33387_1 /TAXON_ID=1462469 /ORGANISM="unid. sp., Strain CCMP2135" /LENGTH=101 /DNA_ID=CAMNT_0044396073 /DNA_START=184 /DNA_END=489 /DNA_ORIENTATION=+
MKEERKKRTKKDSTEPSLEVCELFEDDVHVEAVESDALHGERSPILDESMGSFPEDNPGVSGPGVEVHAAAPFESSEGACEVVVSGVECIEADTVGALVQM